MEDFYQREMQREATSRFDRRPMDNKDAAAHEGQQDDLPVRSTYQRHTSVINVAIKRASA